MLTLHDTTEDIKKLALGGAIIAGAVIIIMIVFRIGVSVFNAVNPPKVAPPTVEFGKLPPMSFPKSVTDEKLTYVNNTISGTLPEFPDRLPVYPIHQDKGTLLNLDQAKSGVSAVGFVVDPVSSDAAQLQLSATDYRWTVSRDLAKTITMNIVSKNFVYTSDYLNYPPVLSAAYLPNENDSVQAVMGFLSQIGANTGDIDETKTKETLFAIQNGILVPAITIGSAQVVRVDLFQGNVDGKPIVYQSPATSPMNALVASGLYTGQVVEAHYFHQGYDKNSASTYPIISASAALSELKNGKAFIVSFNGTTTQVLIGKIYLAYYMSDEPQQYLEPVVVFEGDNDFVAYLPAIDYGRTDAILRGPSAPPK